MLARHDLDASIAAFERAVALNPNYVDWYFGLALARAGDPRRAVEMINRYMRLDPLHAPFASGLLGHAHYMLKEYAQAISLLCDCVSRSPKTRGGRLTLIATYAQMGKVEEARAAVAELMRIEPDYTIGATSRAMVTFKNPDDDQHFFEGLRKAGLAE